MKVPSPVTGLERKMLGFERELPAPSEDIVTQNVVALTTHTRAVASWWVMVLEPCQNVPLCQTMRSESEIWEGRPTKPASTYTFIPKGHLTLGTLLYLENIVESSRIRGMVWLPAHRMFWAGELYHGGHLSHSHPSAST